MAQRKPWVHRGVKLGFIRGPVYWVDRTVNGVRFQVSTGCRTADAAFLEYQRFESDPAHYRPRTEAPGAERTWATLVPRYLEWAKNVKGTSEDHRDAVAKRLANIGAFPGFLSPDTFTRADVEAFVTALREGKVTTRRVTNYVTGESEEVPSRPGQPTVNRYLAALKGFMRWCRDNHHTKNDSERAVKMAREKRNVRPPEAIDKKRWQAVGAQLDARWRAAQEVLLGTGMRYSELARIRAEHLREGGVVIGESKGKVGRVIPVTEATLKSAKALLELGGVPDDQAGQMDHRLDVAARAAGVKRYTAHHLRHTYGTTLLRSHKVDLETLRVWMGHASITTTQKYLHAVRAEEGMPRGVAPR